MASNYPDGVSSDDIDARYAPAAICATCAHCTYDEDEDAHWCDVNCEYVNGEHECPCWKEG